MQQDWAELVAITSAKTKVREAIDMLSEAKDIFDACNNQPRAFTVQQAIDHAEQVTR